jgi:phi13 family phage major tail protein
MPNVNKIKYGLKNVHAAIQTETDGAYTYATPTAIPGAVSLSLEAQGEAEPFYADDCEYYVSAGNNGYSGDLEIALIPEWFRTDILQETKDSNGVLVETSDGKEAVKFALLFEFAGDVKATRHVMYNCTVARPAVGSKTKEENIEPQTESLTITSKPRTDGLVKSKTGDTTATATYEGWYTDVYVPTIETATPATPATPGATG